MQEALELLNGYIKMLAQLKIELPNIQNETLWAGWRQFILNEINWSNNMLVKVKGMML